MIVSVQEGEKREKKWAGWHEGRGGGRETSQARKTAAYKRSPWVNNPKKKRTGGSQNGGKWVRGLSLYPEKKQSSPKMGGQRTLKRSEQFKKKSWKGTSTANETKNWSRKKLRRGEESPEPDKRA